MSVVCRTSPLAASRAHGNLRGLKEHVPRSLVGDSRCAQHGGPNPLTPPCTLRGAAAQDLWTPLTAHSTGFQFAPSRAELVFPSPSTAAVSHQVAPLSPRVQAANWGSLSVLTPNSLPLFSSEPLREFCARILGLWWQDSAEGKTLVQSPRDIVLVPACH